jgi:biopolymer transport protein ExbB/TolQ
MEKDSKEYANAHNKNRSYFIMKVLLLILSLIVVVQFAVVAKGFASLNVLNNRLNTLEEKSVDSESLKPNEEEEPGLKRSKRSTDKLEFKKAMFQLRKIEERQVEILAKTLYVDKYNFDSLRELCLIPIFHN